MQRFFCVGGYGGIGVHEAYRIEEVLPNLVIFSMRQHSG